MNEVKTIEGIVVRLSQYKESDAMVNIVTEEGLVSFSAHGIKKITSKNASTIRPLVHGLFSLSVSSSGSCSLKESKIISEISSKDDYSYMAALSFLTEMVSKLVQEEEAEEEYPWILEAINSFEKGFSPFSTILFLLARFLFLMGYGLDVDECVLCHKKTAIVGVSYQDGGFVCEDEASKDDPSFVLCTSRKLKILRYIFRMGLKDFSRIEFEKGECLSLINELAVYASNILGVSWKSLPLLVNA